MSNYQSRRVAEARHKRRVQMMIAAAAAVLVTLIIVLALQKNGTSFAYPDMEAVKVSEVPADFDVANQPLLGDPNAPIQLVEFADYKCPSCKVWKEEVFNKLKEQYIDTGKMSFVYLDFSFLAEDSHLAALAGETLYQQNPEYFWQYYELMNENQGSPKTEWANFDFIVDLVASHIDGVDLEQFKQDVIDHKYIANVKKDIEIGQKQGVRGTPTVFINGVLYEEPTFEQIQQIVEGQ